MHLLCHRQKQIADDVGMDQATVKRQIDDIMQNGKFSDSHIFRDFEGDENLCTCGPHFLAVPFLYGQEAAQAGVSANFSDNAPIPCPSYAIKRKLRFSLRNLPFKTVYTLLGGL